MKQRFARPVLLVALALNVAVAFGDPLNLTTPVSTSTSKLPSQAMPEKHSVFKDKRWFTPLIARCAFLTAGDWLDSYIKDNKVKLSLPLIETPVPAGRILQTCADLGCKELISPAYFPRESITPKNTYLDLGVSTIDALLPVVVSHSIVSHKMENWLKVLMFKLGVEIISRSELPKKLLDLLCAKTSNPSLNKALSAFPLEGVKLLASIVDPTSCGFDTKCCPNVFGRLLGNYTADTLFDLSTLPSNRLFEPQHRVQATKKLFVMLTAPYIAKMVDSLKTNK